MLKQEFMGTETPASPSSFHASAAQTPHHSELLVSPCYYPHRALMQSSSIFPKNRLVQVWVFEMIRIVVKKKLSQISISRGRLTVALAAADGAPRIQVNDREILSPTGR